MNFSSKINDIRRTITRGLTQNIGRNNHIKTTHLQERKIKRILISRPNVRLGNQLLMTPLVEEILDIFHDAEIDLFVRGNISSVIFEKHSQVNQIIKLPKKPFKELFKYLRVWFSIRKYRYDLAINVSTKSSSGRLSVQFANARYKFFNNFDDELSSSFADYRHIAKLPVYNLWQFLSSMGYSIKHNSVPALHIRLSPNEIAKGQELLNNLTGSNGKETICLYTYATGGKCYSKEWWQKVYWAIKERYEKTHNILEVLPVENVSQIDFQAIGYYSKNIREMASLISDTKLFISADCGVMHLACSTGIPVIGLFSVSCMDVYQPYGNGSIAVNTNTTSIDELIAIISQLLTDQKQL